MSGRGPNGDQIDAAARYLATGDPTGVLDDEARHQLDRTIALLADRCTWAEPSPGLLDAIVDQVERLDWDEHLDRLGGIERVERIETPPRHRTSGRWTHRTTWLLVGSMAAAAMVLLGAVVTGALGPLPPEEDRSEMALAGTDLAPGAQAEAILRNTPSGVAITLRIEGLDPAPLGFYYQAWVKGPRGGVAIGTFHLRGGDRDHEPIELWSGVDRSAYPEITVTLEPEDGNPASSGRKVLGSENA